MKAFICVLLGTFLVRTSCGQTRLRCGGWTARRRASCSAATRPSCRNGSSSWRTTSSGWPTCRWSCSTARWRRPSASSTWAGSTKASSTTTSRGSVGAQSSSPSAAPTSSSATRPQYVKINSLFFTSIADCYLYRSKTKLQNTVC